MRELVYAIKTVIFYQLICWGLFVLVDESSYVVSTTSENISLLVSIIFLVVILILYLIKSNKYIEKHDLNPIKYNIFTFILWNILTIAAMFGFFHLIDIKLLHVCTKDGWGCFLNGIEYGINAVLLISLSVVILITKSLIKLYEYIKKKK